MLTPTIVRGPRHLRNKDYKIQGTVRRALGSEVSNIIKKIGSYDYSATFNKYSFFVTSQYSGAITPTPTLPLQGGGSFSSDFRILIPSPLGERVRVRGKVVLQLWRKISKLALSYYINQFF